LVASPHTYLIFLINHLLTLLFLKELKQLFSQFECLLLLISPMS
jgi:hypothetical protein